MKHECDYCGDDDPIIFVFVGGYGFNEPSHCCCYRPECATRLAVDVQDSAAFQAEEIAEMLAENK